MQRLCDRRTHVVSLTISGELASTNQFELVVFI